MADERFTPPPSNIRIRTMAKDLEALRTGGGILATELPPEPPPPPGARGSEEEAFLYQTPPKETGVLEPRPPSVGEARPDAIGAAPTPQPIPEAKSRRSLAFVLASILFILIFSAFGYYVVWPLVFNAFLPQEEATPSPSPSLSPSPIPTPVNPALFLSKPPSLSISVILDEKTSSGLGSGLRSLKDTKAATQSLITLGFLEKNNTYISPQDFASIALSNAPLNFKESLGSHYLPFLYTEKTGELRLGTAFEIKPEAKENLIQLFRTWESGSIERDFAFLFFGQTPTQRKTNFAAMTREGREFREATFTNNLSLIWAFSDNLLVITTSREALLEFFNRL